MMKRAGISTLLLLSIGVAGCGDSKTAATGAGGGGGRAGAAGGQAGGGGANVSSIGYLPTNAPVRTVAVVSGTPSGTIYVGGFFSGSTALGTGSLTALDEVTFVPKAAWHAQVQPFVNSVAVAGGVAYVGLDLGTNNLLALDAVTGSAIALPSFMGADRPITAVAFSAGTLYLGGTFDRLGVEPRNEFAAVDATTGALLGWAPSDSYKNGWAKTMEIAGGTVYMAGTFTLTNGTAVRGGLAAVDAATGALTSLNAAVGTAGATLAVGGNTLFVGGSFATAAGQPRNRLAAFDLTTGALTAWNPGADGTVQAIGVRGNTVYVAGLFSHVGGQQKTGLAAIDATTGAVAAWAPTFPQGPDYVNALAVTNRVLVVGFNGGVGFYALP